MCIADVELLDLNSKGFIPGPSESEEDFLKRIAAIQKTFAQSEQIPFAHWDWVRIFLKKVFDFEPYCLSAFYSNHSLMPWQGAAAWIEGNTLVSIQLREAFKKKSSYLGVYKREEILAHEAVHAARSAFQEPQNEEFFAYMSSEKKWRRVLGPIFVRPWEIWPFFLSIAIGSFFSFAYFIGACLSMVGFYRLIRQHGRLKRASRQILRYVKQADVVRAILLRLTDAEIVLFSKGENIEDYRRRQRCLRWRLINLAYFN